MLVKCEGFVTRQAVTQKYTYVDMLDIDTGGQFRFSAVNGAFQRMPERVQVEVQARVVGRQSQRGYYLSADRVSWRLVGGNGASVGAADPENITEGGQVNDAG